MYPRHGFIFLVNVSSNRGLHRLCVAALVYIQINATSVTEWFAPLLSNTVGPRLAN